MARFIGGPLDKREHDAVDAIEGSASEVFVQVDSGGAPMWWVVRAGTAAPGPNWYRYVAVGPGVWKVGT